MWKVTIFVQLKIYSKFRLPNDLVNLLKSETSNWLDFEYWIEMKVFWLCIFHTWQTIDMYKNINSNFGQDRPHSKIQTYKLGFFFLLSWDLLSKKTQVGASLYHLFKISIKRAIFQTFWRLHCCPNCLFIEFLVNYKNKKHQRGDPCKMCNINVVQSSSNFAQFSKIKK